MEQERRAHARARTECYLLASRLTSAYAAMPDTDLELQASTLRFCSDQLEQLRATHGRLAELLRTRVVAVGGQR